MDKFLWNIILVQRKKLSKCINKKAVELRHLKIGTLMSFPPHVSFVFYNSKQRISSLVPDHINQNSVQ